MGIIEAITEVARSVASIFGYSQQRDGERNAPDVREAAKTADQQKAIDQLRNDTAHENTKETQLELADPDANVKP